MAIKIVIDSACDYTLEEIKERGLYMLPLTVNFGEVAYKDLQDISHDEFFEKLIETDELPKTSCVGPYDYEKAFQEIVEQGDEVLCITVSSKLSGCYQSACIAADEFESGVMVVDSLNACLGQRILVDRAIEIIGEGKSLAEVAAQLDEEKKNIRLVALLDTLEYLKKGGRISSTVAFAGALLSIKPVICIEDGEVKFMGAARGSKNGNNKLIEMINKEGGPNLELPHALAYSGLSTKLLEKYMKDSASLYEGKLDEIPVTSIGAAIGTHIGPGAIAFTFFTK